MNRRLLAIAAVVVLTGLLAVTTFASSDGTTQQAPPAQLLADDADDIVEMADEALEEDAQDADAADDQDDDANDDPDQDADDDQGGEREIKGIPDKSEVGGPPEGAPLDSPARSHAPPYNPDLVATVETPGGVTLRVPAHAAEHMEAAFAHGQPDGDEGQGDVHEDSDD